MQKRVAISAQVYAENLYLSNETNPNSLASWEVVEIANLKNRKILAFPKKARFLAESILPLILISWPRFARNERKSIAGLTKHDTLFRMQLTPTL